MAMLKSTQATLRTPAPNADRAIELIPIFGDYVLTGNEASGDIIEMCPLPRGMVPVDVIVDTEDLGTTVTSDVGIMSGAWLDTGTRTMGAEFITGTALGTAQIKRMDVQGSTSIAPTTGDRSVGIKMTTVSTPTAGNTVRVTLMCRPAIEGV